MQELKPQLVNLKNGLRFVYLHAPNQVAHLGVTVLAGSRFEQADEVGLAHFLEHCIFKGTHKRKTYHILSRLDAVGGELNAYTAKEEICVYAAFSKEYTARAADLLADIVINSNFPLKEIEKEKEIVLDEINSYLDSPGDKIFDEFEYLLFEGNPLGTNILGTPESVQSFSTDQLNSYLARFFTVDKMVLSFVGDVPLNRIVKLLDQAFEGVPLQGEQVQIKPVTNTPKFHVRSKEANYQSHAVIGGLAPGYKHEHRRGMTLLNNMLGGPALNSRLILSIREKYGYAYNVESSYTPYFDTGFWSVYVGTDQKNLDKSIRLIERELKTLCTKKMGSLQLERAKVQLKGHLALGMDSNSGLMLGLGKSLLLFDQIDTVQEIYEGIDNLTAEELLEIANIYFDPTAASALIYEMD